MVRRNGHASDLCNDVTVPEPASAFFRAFPQAIRKRLLC